MRLPDFLGVGTQKGGTTYLHGLLNQHPQVFLAHPKELHYFSKQYERGVDWYSEHFSMARQNQCCGEITPYYMYHPLVPQRIASGIPKVRLVVLLRDPVKRAISQYFHSCRQGLEYLDFEEALASEAERLEDVQAVMRRGDAHLSHQQHSYVSRSCYDEQLPRLIDLFSSDQLLVLRSEDLFINPQTIWDRALEFLQLDDYPLPSSDRTYAGGGEAKTVPAEICAALYQRLSPTYRWMEENYGMSWREFSDS